MSPIPNVCQWRNCFYSVGVSAMLMFRLFPQQWKGEIQEFCPNTKMLMVGCKSDLRTDVSTLVELSNHRQTPVSYDQVCICCQCTSVGFKKDRNGTSLIINKINRCHFS